jgi:Zn-dependent M28 family amino/carboxypeptidase
LRVGVETLVINNYKIAITLNYIFKISLFFIPLVLFVGCNKKKSVESTTQNQPTVVQAPNFNPDSAFNFVAQQIAFGPRVPNSKAHIQCGDYLIATLKKYNFEVSVQSFNVTAFDNKNLNARNIIGSINPTATKRIILASHWDSRPFADQDKTNTNSPIDGANDGASGVGVLLELARVISNSTQKPSVGIDIIFFDVEDYGQPENSGFPEKNDTWCLGSQYWSSNKHKPNYSAYYGVLLDMVGAKDAKYAMEGTSMYYAPGVVNKIWGTANALGYGNRFVYNQVENIVDDHYYVNSIAKIPMADIIEYENSDGSFFSKTWHTHDDTIENIDKNSLKAVGQTLLQVVYNE